MKNSKRGIAALLVLAMLCTMLPGMSLRTSAAELDTQTAATEAAQTKPTETEAAQTKPTETVPPVTEREKTVQETTGETVLETTEEALPETQENTARLETFPEETAPQETALAETVVAEETVATLVESAEENNTATGTCGDDLTWELDENGILTISGTGTMYNYEIDRGPWSEYTGSIVSAVISEGVTSIGDYAFFDCTNLTSISIPVSVVSIGEWAFERCRGLTSITIPINITNISKGAFCDCTGLVSVVIPAGVTSIANAVFSDCRNLVSITIPANVTSIGTGAFRGCSSLTDITIPASVTSIGNYAYAECINLTNISISANVTSIGNCAFSDCTRLTQIRFEGNACTIGDEAFQNVTATVFYPANDTTWTSDAMQDYGGTLTWEDYGIKIEQQPQDCSAHLGKTATLSILTSGGEASYQWFWSEDGVTWQACENGNGSQLTVSVTNECAGKLYRCEATDSDGTTLISDIAIITVLPAYGTIQPGETVSGAINTEWECVYYAFTPQYTESYTVTAKATYLNLRLYDSSMNLLKSASNRFAPSITYTMEAGKTYILSAGDTSVTGSYSITLNANHDDSNAVITPSTCTGDGQKVYTCSVCGQQITEVIPAAGHTWDEGVVNPKATCSATGVITYTCTTCGEEITETIPAIGHTLGEGTVTQQATCDSEGIMTYTCTVCQEQVTEVIPKQHDYDENGVCKLCGDKHMLELEVGYNWGTDDGIPVWGYYFISEYTESYTFLSTYCGDTVGYLYDSDMNLLAYDDDGDAAFEDTSGSGFAITYTLQANQKYILRVQMYPDGSMGGGGIRLIANHSYEAVTTPATCTEDGSIVYTCTACGDSYSETIQAAHSWDTGVVMVKATCETDGFATYTCTTCGEKKTERITGTHTWDDGKITKEATCEADGEILYTCTVCGEQYTEIVPGVHNYQNGYCTVCGAERIVEETSSDGLSWKLDGSGRLTISGSGSMNDYSEYYYSAPWSQYWKDIKCVEIVEGVTSIGTYAFCECFYLETVIIPASVLRIGEYAFESCRSLKDIQIDGGNPNYSSDGAAVLYNKDKTCLIAVPTYWSGAFSIPSGVTEIAAYAFSNGAYVLETVTIPASVTKINDKAFYSCGVECVWFEGDAPEFGDTAFSGRNYDFTVFYPGDNATWTESVLQDYGGSPEWVSYTAEEYGCGDFGDGLHWALDGNGLLTISGTGPMPNFGYDYVSDTDLEQPWYVFRRQIKRAVIEEGITSIGNGTFQDHTALAEVTIPNGVTSIGDNAFNNCSSLTSVIIPDSVQQFGYSIFLDCSSLASVKLPQGMTTIADTMFGRCHSLAEIEIPSTVTVIETYAFSSCDALEIVVLPEGLTTIGSHAFQRTALKEITIPDKVTSLGSSAFLCCTQLSKIILPSKVLSIGANAFGSCRNLAQITIPETVKKIGWGAFAYCTSLTEVKIPDGVTYLGGTFYGCTALQHVEIPDSVTNLAYYAFADCTSLTSIDMPANLERIGDQAFARSGINEIEIPVSVKELDNAIFADCTAFVQAKFLGDAPDMALYAAATNQYNLKGTFTNVTAMAYYPSNNTTWTQDLLSSDYGGIITWLSYEPQTEVIPGDIDGSGIVDINDAAELLWANLYSDGSSAQDLNNDGKKDENDVVYLLWHILFPDLFPL